MEIGMVTWDIESKRRDLCVSTYGHVEHLTNEILRRHSCILDCIGDEILVNFKEISAGKSQTRQLSNRYHGIYMFRIDDNSSVVSIENHMYDLDREVLFGEDDVPNLEILTKKWLGLNGEPIM